MLRGGGVLVNRGMAVTMGALERDEVRDCGCGLGRDRDSYCVRSSLALWDEKKYNMLCALQVFGCLSSRVEWLDSRCLYLHRYYIKLT